MFEYFEGEKAKKKAMTTAEKKELKKAKDELEGPYATCLLDGRKEKVGNFRVEPPGLFKGRGDHPKKGKLKVRNVPLAVGLAVLTPSRSYEYVQKISLSTSERTFPYLYPTHPANGRRSFTIARSLG